MKVIRLIINLISLATKYTTCMRGQYKILSTREGTVNEGFMFFVRYQHGKLP